MTDAADRGASPATEWAFALLAALIERGVRDVVVCPGSRSQALALVAAEAERVEAIRLHVRVDERSAGFFALGIARETGVPAPVIVTSGTAVANLMPAALEAHEGRVPMLLLTADRPAELHGIRSNQTTEQGRLLDPFARLVVEVPAPGSAEGSDSAGLRVVGSASAASRLGNSEPPERLVAAALSAAAGFAGEAPAGPVQLNLAFREPLSSPVSAAMGEQLRALREAADAEMSRAAAATPAATTSAATQACVTDPFLSRTHLGFDESETYVHDGDRLTVVIAGADAGSEAEAFAHEAGLPLLAEAVSGSRFGREAIAGYAAFIDDPAIGGLTERAIVFGHPTLTRQIPGLIARDDVETIVVDPYCGDQYDPARSARIVRTARVAEHYDRRTMRRWLGAWVTADRERLARLTTVHAPDLEAAVQTGYKERSAYARAEVAAMREPVSRAMLVEHAWLATWPHDRLVLGSSTLVRALDAIAPARKLRVHANRGLAGIDGTVATAAGIAAASQGQDDPGLAAGVTRVILGDLALLHDSGSLALPPAEPHPRLQLLVGNDGGGTIFDRLEVARTADPDLFDRVMYTPHRVDLEQLAAAYGWAYERVETRGDLDRVFTAQVTGPQLVDVRLPRSEG